MSQPDRVSEGRPVHRWKPIEDLPADLAALTRATAEVAAIRRNWAGKKAELEASGALREFNERLCRQWCIETGILEGIYTLDRGATRTLIEHGFDAALLSHGDTNIGEATLIQILRDHEQAIEGLFSFVKQDRPLTTSYVKALHQVLVAHQDDIEVLDHLGRLSRLPLRRGDWKLIPNNPGDPRTLELVHEYGPPEEVAAEMDRLVALHAGHDGVEAEISAAWLHHRFVQVHPFQDGNGRVARALASLVLIQKGGFPFVVLRDDKNDYIDALRAADDGDLLPFVEFVCRLQKHALLQAMKPIDEALALAATREAVLQDAQRRLRVSAARRDDAVHSTAMSLLARAGPAIDSAVRQVSSIIASTPEASAAATSSRPSTEHLYDEAVLDAAGGLGYVADLTGPHPWLELEIRKGRKTSLLLSFHRVGSPDAAVMAASVVVLRFDAVERLSRSEPATNVPFTFTADRDREELGAAFDAWLERSLTLGLAVWRRSL
jgi:hypothetical protein